MDYDNEYILVTLQLIRLLQKNST